MHLAFHQSRGAWVLAVVALGLAIAGAIAMQALWPQTTLPADISRDGHRIDAALAYTTKLVAGYFLLVVAILVVALARFRAAPGRHALYTHGDKFPHLALTLALAASVFVLVDLRLIHTSTEDLTTTFWNYPEGKEVLPVEVRGQQFEWHFRYAGPDGKFNTADDVESNGVMHVPVGRPVVVHLRSADVIHSLFLPFLRLKQDAVPGRTTRLWFQADHAGEYEIACTQFCGLGHYKMRARLIAQDQAAFDAWLAKESKDAVDEYDPKDDKANWGWDWEEMR